MARIHSQTTKRSSQQHSHCSCTSSRLKPDTKGFPGSRPQHEAIESPEVTVRVKLPGFCCANTHDQPLLWAVTYFQLPPWILTRHKDQKCLTQCHKHQESRCTEGLKIVSRVGNVSGYTGLLWSAANPLVSGKLRWPLGKQRQQSETKEFAAAPSLNVLRTTEGRKDRQKGARSQGCFWLWTGSWKFCHKANSPSHNYTPLAKQGYWNKPGLLLWLMRLWNQLHQSFGSGAHGREDKCFLAQTNRKL